MIINAVNNICNPKPTNNIQNNNNNENNIKTNKGSTIYCVTLTDIDDDHQQCIYEVTWHTSTNVQNPPIDDNLAAYIHSVVHGPPSHQNINTTAVVCTEYNRFGVPFRCHPNYRSQGPWYDWAMVQFEVTDNNNNTWQQDYPSQIVALLMQHMNPTLHEHKMVVLSCSDRNIDADSVLLQEWTWDATTFYSVPVASLVAPIFVMYGIGNNNTRIVHVKDHAIWPHEFLGPTY